MPIHSKYQNNSFELLVWNITEPTSFFIEKLSLSTESVKELNQNFSHQNSLLQWLASRFVLQILFNRPYTDFIKNEKGKLEIIDNSCNLSISHSQNKIVVVRSAQKIGIDIQLSTPKLFRIATKYIDHLTLHKLQSSQCYNDYLHIYWGVKEALFKAFGLGQLNFIKDLHLMPFVFQDEGHTTAKVIKDNFEINYHVFYQKKEDFYLCIVIEESLEIS